MPSLDEYISQVKTLPPAPRILPQLLELLREDNLPPSRIVDLITFDPALTARLMKRCNSTTFGWVEPVCDLAQAVQRLGYNEVYRLVATVVSESTLCGSQSGYGIAAGELWQHSVAAAVAGRLVAQSRGIDENLVFTAALLHDIGKLVLSGYLADSYASIQRETEVSHRSLLEVERMLLGVDHAEVGGRLLASWEFPDKLVQAVWRHHEPDRAHAFAELAASVCLGDVIAHLIGHGHGYQAFALRIQSDLLHRLQLDATQLELLAIQTDTTLRQMGWFAPKSP